MSPAPTPPPASGRRSRDLGLDPGSGTTTGARFVAATFPEGQALWLTLTYNVGGVVVFLGGALAWYERCIRRLRAADPAAAAAELAPSAPDRSADNQALLDSPAV